MDMLASLDEQTWQSFNESNSGRLVRTFPSAAVCHAQTTIPMNVVLPKATGQQFLEDEPAWCVHSDVLGARTPGVLDQSTEECTMPTRSWRVLWQCQPNGRC